MTTQELKNKIEKVLGNNIRCLLPSYWWKNLFHSVADRIDEVETTITENVNDMVVKSLKEFEVKHPDMVSSTLYYTQDASSAEARSNASKLIKWALSITDKPSGTIGNALYVAVPVLEAEYNSFSHVIQSPVFRLAVGVNSESTVEFLNVPMSDGQNYNIVFGVTSGVATLQPASSSSDGGSVMFVVDPIGDLTEEQKQNNSDAFLKVLEAEGAIDINIMVMFFIAKPNMVSVNDNGNLVLVAAGIDGGASRFIFTPEGDVTIETVEPTSSGGVEIRELYIYEDPSGKITELTDEQKAWNLETFEFFVEKKAIVRYRMSNYQWFYLDTLDNGYMRSYIATTYGVVCISLNVDEEGLAYAAVESQAFDDTVSESTKAVQSRAVKTALDGKQDSLVSGINIKTINGKSILGEGDMEFADSAMSDTSTNAVQNNVVKKYIDDNLSNAEKVYAAALVDLDARIQDIVARLNNAGL